jgi:hypothetical protein
LPATLNTIVNDAIRVLSFRRPSKEIADSWQRYLAFGLLFTWLAGVGRYWDSPRAEFWQHAGFGSLAYVFVLAGLLWLIITPLKPMRWSFKNTLIFVTLTSPPAVLYAIPVERFMSLENAQTANALFLGIVATWRVALLVWFLRAVSQLTWLRIIVATLLPLTLIVVSLSLLNLEHVVFNIMSGIRPEDRSANDGAYTVVLILTYFSVMAFPFALVLYLGLVFASWRKR